MIYHIPDFTYHIEYRTLKVDLLVGSFQGSGYLGTCADSQIALRHETRDDINPAGSNIYHKCNYYLTTDYQNHHLCMFLLESPMITGT